MFLASKYRAPALAFGLSASLLVGAWVFQYGFGYAPCTMCYWQRHMHKVIIAVAALGLLAAALGKTQHPAQLLTGLAILALLGSAGLGFFHMGVELKWWDGPKTCATGTPQIPIFDPSDPLGGLDKKIKPPSCDVAVWHFLGLSMAAWNGVLSLMGAIGTALLLRRKL